MLRVIGFLVAAGIIVFGAVIFLTITNPLMIFHLRKCRCGRRFIGSHKYYGGCRRAQLRTIAKSSLI